MLCGLTDCGVVQARGEVDSRRTKLAKLRGTPGIKEEKVCGGHGLASRAGHGS